MDTQDNDRSTMPEANANSTRVSGQRFPEPTAWALKWDAHSYDPGPPHQPQAEPSEEKQPKRDSGKKFPQPRGWALKWDGFTISAIQDFYNQPSSTDAETPKDRM